MGHMTRNNLLSDLQHGFIRGRSCSAQLLAALDEWTRALQDGDNIDVIYLDLTKAFDTVPLCRLQTKLEKYGISGDILLWIEAFLTGRRQRVRIKGTGLQRNTTGERVGTNVIGHLYKRHAQDGVINDTYVC